MPIRLFVKSQPAQTVTKFDISKPIEQVGAELIEKAKAEAKVMVPKVIEHVENVVEKVVAATIEAVEEEVEAVVAAKTKKVVEEEKPAPKKAKK